MDVHPLSPAHAATACGRSARRLWIEYLALGGAWTQVQFGSYLVRSGDGGRADVRDDPGDRPAAAVQRDVVAHALNEALMDTADSGRVPYGHTWGWPVDPASLPVLPEPSTPRTHRLALSPALPGVRVLTSAPRGSQWDDDLVCGRCDALLALGHRPPARLGGLLRCSSCAAVNDPATAG